MLYQKILKTTIEELKESLIKYDVNSEFYEENTYASIEKELDRRQKK